MTRLTAELAALAELEVPVVNHRFDISPHAAARLWSEGEPLPEAGDYPPDYHPSPTRILRSADGRWLIRRQVAPLPADILTTHETVDTAAVELERLQTHGIDVVSHGITTSPMAETIFTVSPWIPDMVPCGEDAFRAAIAPRVGHYFRDSLGELVLYDVGKKEQFSSCAATDGQPFMHDADPELGPIVA